MKISSVLKVCLAEKESAELNKLLGREVKSGNRAKVAIKKDKEGLGIYIDADDVASLRSQENAILQFLSLYEQSKDIK